jgi:hypothetical protein
VQYAVPPAVAVATIAVLWLRLQVRRPQPEYAGL